MKGDLYLPIPASISPAGFTRFDVRRVSVYLTVTHNAHNVNKFVHVAMYFRYAGDWTALLK